jgi:hypothetical protein
VGALTTSRIHDDFEQEVAATTKDLRERVRIKVDITNGQVTTFRPNLTLYVAGSKDAVARVVDRYGNVLRASRGAPDLGRPVPGPA